MKKNLTIVLALVATVLGTEKSVAGSLNSIYNAYSAAQYAAKNLPTGLASYSERLQTAVVNVARIDVTVSVRTFLIKLNNRIEIEGVMVPRILNAEKPTGFAPGLGSAEPEFFVLRIHLPVATSGKTQEMNADFVRKLAEIDSKLLPPEKRIGIQMDIAGHGVVRISEYANAGEVSTLISDLSRALNRLDF